MTTKMYFTLLSVVTILLPGLCGAGILDAILTAIDPLRDTFNLDKAPDDMKYSFILVRNGMRAPYSTQSNTFPSDTRYQTQKWYRGRTSNSGLSLLKLVGRSLETRYGRQMRTWTPEGSIYVSAYDIEFALSGAESLEDGLLQNHRLEFSGKIRPVPAEFDKSGVFSEEGVCPSYDQILAAQTQSIERDFIRDKRDFLQDLDEQLAKPGEPLPNEWKIRSLMQVYWLWEILDFEKSTRKDLPSWIYKKNRGKDIDGLVELYLKEIIYSDERLPKYLVGRMFSEIYTGYMDPTRRLHIHVTDERMFSAFKYMLTGVQASTAQFGEALIIEVDSRSRFSVYSFMPLRSGKLRKLVVRDFREDDSFGQFLEYYSKSLYVPMTEEDWIKMCRDPNYIPPSVSSSLDQRSSSFGDSRRGRYGTTYQTSLFNNVPEKQGRSASSSIPPASARHFDNSESKRIAEDRLTPQTRYPSRTIGSPTPSREYPSLNNNEYGSQPKASLWDSAQSQPRNDGLPKKTTTHVSSSRLAEEKTDYSHTSTTQRIPAWDDQRLIHNTVKGDTVEGIGGYRQPSLRRPNLSLDSRRTEYQDTPSTFHQPQSNSLYQAPGWPTSNYHPSPYSYQLSEDDPGKRDPNRNLDYKTKPAEDTQSSQFYSPRSREISEKSNYDYRPLKSEYHPGPYSHELSQDNYLDMSAKRPSPLVYGRLPWSSDLNSPMQKQNSQRGPEELDRFTPRGGEYGRGSMDNYDGGRRTVQRNEFKSENKKDDSYHRKEGCDPNSPGGMVNCVEVKSSSSSHNLVKHSQTTTTHEY